MGYVSLPEGKLAVKLRGRFLFQEKFPDLDFPTYEDAWLLFLDRKAKKKKHQNWRTEDSTKNQWTKGETDEPERIFDLFSKNIAKSRHLLVFCGSWIKKI